MKKTLMKIVKPQTALLGALLVGSALFNPSAQAAEKPETKVEVPTTTDAIWQSIDKRSEELAKVIETGKLNEVHLHAFAIRDLVAAIPARSGALPADKLAKIKTNSQFVATLAERLDASGDAKDKVGTESNFQKLQKVLKTMRENYTVR